MIDRGRHRRSGDESDRMPEAVAAEINEMHAVLRAMEIASPPAILQAGARLVSAAVDYVGQLLDTSLVERRRALRQHLERSTESPQIPSEETLRMQAVEQLSAARQAFIDVARTDIETT